ncbi:MAG TPA: type II secretion system F family protein [Oscillospiraceae bacterium]|nr:type II secretion system F family protein [Oscillospiraceae bacterium]HPF55306.1 type II secretion system F family protein [Clostridiales bacterium]HPK34709.1 type II secretion system F family protein [Oscillospiraceae bacterium]HPR74527.1 type II secretion system F family protein [Oscillospiraceae bacterium]
MMRYVVLSVVSAVFAIVVAILARVGQKWDATGRRLNAIRNVQREYGDEELKKSFADRLVRPFLKKVSSAFKRKDQASSKQSKSMEKLSRLLKTAGKEITATEFTTIKSILTVVVLFICLLIFRFSTLEMLHKLLILLFGMIACILGPKSYVNSKVKKRKEEIVHDLPDVMDLLVVSAEAGLGLDASITRLAQKNKGVVVSELAAAVKNIQMGVPRRTSFKELADRCDVKELTAFTTAIIQAEQLGVPIKNVLTSQADRLRVERRQRIQAKAMKAPVKIMLPTIGFIFPVIFIILLGPAVMNLIEVFT